MDDLLTLAQRMQRVTMKFSNAWQCSEVELDVITV